MIQKTWSVNPTTRDFIIMATLGKIPGVATENKFGRAKDTGALGSYRDIWDGWDGSINADWVPPASAQKFNISSSSTDDDIDGVGAKTIRVWGLTSWSTSEVSEDIDMDGAGSNSQPTTNSYVIIHRMKAVDYGASGPNVGLITATGSVTSTAKVYIQANEGQTQMAIYGVPSNQTALVGRLYSNVNQAAGASSRSMDSKLLVNEKPDQQVNVFIVKHTFGLVTTGNNALTIPYYVPRKFPGPAIIKVQGNGSANNMDVSGGFDIILFDN